MAEILVRAKNHWAESIPPGQRNSWPQKRKDKFERRIQFGDIMRVEEDGFVWGSKEGMPDWILIKVLGLSKAEAEQYIDLIEDVPDAEGNAKKLRRKRYGIPKNICNQIIGDGGERTYLWADVQGMVIDYIT